MILIVTINFISFYARSISCFKTIQPVNIMLFFSGFYWIWQLEPLPSMYIMVPSTVLRHGMYRGRLLLLQQESFLLRWFLERPLMDAAEPEAPTTAALDKSRVDVCQRLSESLWQRPWTGCQAGAVRSVGGNGGGWAPQIPEPESPLWRA